MDFVAKLNEYSQKQKYSPPKYEIVRTEGQPHLQRFTMRVELNGIQYPEGVGLTKQKAKHATAENAYRSLFSDDHHADTIPNENLAVRKGTRCQDNSDSSFRNPNYIGILNHYCQKKLLRLNLDDVTVSGPAHNRRFVCKAKINNKEYPEAEGTTKKEAQKLASQRAWENLQEQSDWDSKVSLRSTVSEEGAQSDASEPSETQESDQQSSQNVQTNESDPGIPAASSKGFQVKASTVSEEESAQSDATEPKATQESDEQSTQSVPNSESDPVIPAASTEAFQVDENNQRGDPAQSRFQTDYDSKELLGKGGFGRVYKGRRKLINKFYAIKIVNVKEKTLREVQALSRLQHENIVRYYDCWIEEGNYKRSNKPSNRTVQDLYIEMELCDKKTLRHWIKENNQASLETFKRREESRPIVQQIIHGVEYIHSLEFIHRDLKPGNIMFANDGAVKIGDFGLVTTESKDDNENPIERTAGTGTRSYMAPEQRETTYDQKVDMFAIGLIFFEMLWKMSTGHEREHVWRDLREQNLPTEFKQSFFHEHLLIKSLLSEKPEVRPEASVVKTKLEEMWDMGNDKTV